MASYKRSPNGNIIGTYSAEEYQREQAERARRHGNLKDRGYPSSTNPTSQPKTKKTRGTLETKEKAKTRSTIEAAFVGNNTKSGPPSKEEQERMRKQGAKNAANQYAGKYSGRRG